MRFLRFAPIGLALLARTWAQDVTVGDPVWMRTTPAPTVLPLSRHRLRPDFPSAVKKSGDIGYVIVIREVTADGESSSLRALGNEMVYQRAVEAKFTGWEMKPAEENGQAVSATIWLAVVFNPPSAAKDNPEATPRLLSVTPVRLPAGLLPASVESASIPSRLEIDAQGAVTDLFLDPGAPAALVEAMRDEVRRWRFAPARHNRQTVPAEVNLPILVLGEIYPTDTRAKMIPPVAIKHVHPVYPVGMLSSRLRGVVLVDFVVDMHGDVQNAVVMQSNNPGFDESAVAAVSQWKFKPGTKDDKAVNTHMQVPMVFEINYGGSSDAFSVEDGTQSKLPPEFRYDTPPIIRGAADPVYPYALLRDGVEGNAMVAFIISARGDVRGIQVVSASRPEFGLALTAAVDTFRFDPALKQGRPTQTVMTREIHFYRDMINLSDIANRPGDDLADRDFYLVKKITKRPETLVSAATLDHPLHPLSTRGPVFPSSQYGKAQHGSALIDVVIDEEGRARIPRVISATDPAFAYAAIQAVASWRFEKPTVGGKSVTTQAEVPFEFKVQ
jgi:TonB family protein